MLVGELNWFEEHKWGRMKSGVFHEYLTMNYYRKLKNKENIGNNRKKFLGANFFCKDSH